MLLFHKKFPWTMWQFISDVVYKKSLLSINFEKKQRCKFGILLNSFYFLFDYGMSTKGSMYRCVNEHSKAIELPGSLTTSETLHENFVPHFHFSIIIALS